MLTIGVNTVALMIENEGHYKLFDSHAQDRCDNVSISGKNLYWILIVQGKWFSIFKVFMLERL